MRDFVNSLCFQDKYDSVMRQFVSKIKSFSNIYCYGAGSLCDFSLAEFERFGLDLKKIDCVFDSNPKKDGTKVHGVTVSSHFTGQLKPSSIVIITTTYSEEVRKKLSSAGVEFCVTPAYINDRDIIGKRGPEFISFVKEHLDELEYIYNLLADEKSRRVFLGVINYRMTSDISYLSDYIDGLEYQYFDPVVKLTPQETFIDAGAFDGDTIKSYLDHTNGTFKKIIAFETDQSNFEKLSSLYESNKNIICINKGVYSQNTILRFCSTSSTGGHLSDSGDIEIPVCKIDSELSEPVSYIKMDIEGSEYYALIGAHDHIVNDKPKIAACIYHELVDLIRIPMLLKSMNSNYKLYVRHYKRDFPMDTVCYAIPDSE